MFSAYFLSNACERVPLLSHVRLSPTPWTIAGLAPLSMEFSRQEYWSGLPFPSPGDLPDPGIEPTTFASPAWAGGFFTTKPPGRSLLLSNTELHWQALWLTIFFIFKN